MAKKINTIDEQITQLFAVISKQSAELKIHETAVARPWKTNCSLTLPHQRPVNLQIANVDVLVSSLAILNQITQNTKEAADQLGLPCNSAWDGYSMDDWVEDFKKRAALIIVQSKRVKLEALESRLNSIVSPEQRRELELSAIMNEMDND